MFSELFTRGENMYSDYRIFRDFKKLTDYKVAQATGISRSTFSDWKSGRSAPKLEKLKKIAEFLEVPVEYITGDGSNSTPLDILSNDEINLLHLFRGLSREKRTSLIEYAQYLVDTQKKTDSSKVG